MNKPWCYVNKKWDKIYFELKMNSGGKTKKILNQTNVL